MTRAVNLVAQQRVDQPDAMAWSAFGTMDLRRVMRQVMLGSSDVLASISRVVRGFAVEPEVPGAQATGYIQLPIVVGDILDAETFTLNDGVNAPVVFHFTTVGAGPVQTPTLRVMVLPTVQALTREAFVVAVINAINGAPTLDLVATRSVTAGRVAIENTRTRTLGNQAITDTVVSANFITNGMAGGSNGNTRVLVRMSLGGSGYGAALGAVDQGGVLDWGQLAGDRDGAGNLEGSAQNVIDFAGQPAATYAVKMRMAFAEGVVDNRAFWNPTANAEYIKATPTRVLPQWQIALNPAGLEWMPLGSVVWNGADITSTEVSDTRMRPIEGAPDPAAGDAVQRWSAAAQETAAFGVGDFDRSTDRGDAPGVSGVWEILRALGRQVQDLKGAREGDGRFDWFSRPAAPPGFYDADPTTKKSKSLRTLDTVSFTISDGESDQGDFNGVTAFDDCMQFIEANQDSLPYRIEIVFKDRRPNPVYAGYAPPTWVPAINREAGHTLADTVDVPRWKWITPVLIYNKDIRISQAAGNALPGNQQDLAAWKLQSPVDTLAVTFKPLRGMGSVDLSTVALGTTTPMLRLYGESKLTVADVEFADFAEPATMSLFDCGVETQVCMRNVACRPTPLGYAGASPSGVAATGFSLRASHQGLLLDRCEFGGNCWLGGAMVDATLAAANPSLPAANYYGEVINGIGGLVQYTSFFTHVRMRYTNTFGVGEAPYVVASKLTFSHCMFSQLIGRSGASWVGSSTGLLDGSGSRDCVVDHCLFTHAADLDGAVFAALDTGANALGVVGLEFTNNHCQIGAGVHQPYLGYGLTEGTGWALKLLGERHAVATLSASALPLNCKVTGNTAFPIGGPAGMSLDAGAFLIRDALHCDVKNNTVIGWFPPTEPTAIPSEIVLINVTATSTGSSFGGGAFNTVSDNFVGEFGAGAFGPPAPSWGDLARLICVGITLQRSTSVHHNIISAEQQPSSPRTWIDPSENPAAMLITNSTAVDIHDNKFDGWASASDIIAHNTALGFRGTNIGISVKANKFIFCGGYCIAYEPLAVSGMAGIGFDFVVDSNEHINFTDTVDYNGFIDLDATDALVTRAHCRNNSWGAILGPARNVIRLSTDKGSVLHNYVGNGNIFVRGMGGVYAAGMMGYGIPAAFPGVPDVNFCIGYL